MCLFNNFSYFLIILNIAFKGKPTEKRRRTNHFLKTKLVISDMIPALYCFPGISAKYKISYIFLEEGLYS